MNRCIRRRENPPKLLPSRQLGRIRTSSEAIMHEETRSVNIAAADSVPVIPLPSRATLLPCHAADTQKLGKEILLKRKAGGLTNIFSMANPSPSLHCDLCDFRFHGMTPFPSVLAQVAGKPDMGSVSGFGSGSGS